MAKGLSLQKTQPVRHFVREWRKFRGLTQEQLADRLGITHGAISQLENGRIGYIQATLEALADALTCTPADLLMRNPVDAAAPWPIIDRLAKIDEPTRKRVIRVVEELLRDGTEG